LPYLDLGFNPLYFLYFLSLDIPGAVCPGVNYGEVIEGLDYFPKKCVNYSKLVLDWRVGITLLWCLDTFQVLIIRLIIVYHAVFI
jgi:hypothetical protein